MLDVLIKKLDIKTPQKGIIKVSDRSDKPIKSIMKSVSWRLIGTIDTMVISYIITGRITLALSIGSAEVITKTVLYYFHERLWAHIHRLQLKIFIKSNKKQYGSERVEQLSSR